MTVFPAVPLDVRAAISLTADAWTDITPYAYAGQGQPQAVIGRGKPDESGQAQPGTCQLKVSNQDARFSFSNPLGPWYGRLGRNTPVRVSIPAQGSYLRLEGDTASYASCPDTAGLHIISDLDIRIDVDLSGWATGILAARWVNGGSANSWLLVLNGDATITLFWSTTGSDFPEAASTMPLPAYGGRMSIRAALDVNNGAGGRTVTFWTGPAGGADGSTWAQLGAPVIQAGTTSINAGALPVAAGNYCPGGNELGITGRVFELEVRSGIGGTVVAHPVFSAQAEGAASFADAQGNTWSPAGTAEISARSYRFHGEMSSSAQAQDPTGTQRWVPLACGGLLRRVQQGQAPVASAMRRAVQSQAGTLAPVAYWPCEDLPGSASIASGIGGPAMTMTGGTGDGTIARTGASFGADSSFAASLPLPQLATSAWLGTVPAYASNGSLIVRFLLDVSTGPVNTARIIRVITTGTCQEWVVYYGTGGALGVAGFGGPAGAGVFDSGLFAFGVLAQPVWVSMELRPGGGSTVNWSMATLTPGGGAVGISGTFTGTIGNAVQVQPGPTQLLGAVAIGHVSVQSDWQSLFGLAAPLQAWAGETAGSRFSRLCGENGLASRVYGPPATTAAMGAQSASPLATLLQECEDADRGMIYEPRQAYALGYRTLASMLGQPAMVTAAWGDLDGEAWQPPSDDDQRTVNDAIVTRSSGNAQGTQFRSVLADGSPMSISPPPAGVGDYQQTYQVNVQSDVQVPDVAGWITHVGTARGSRYPGLPLNLARSDAQALMFAAQEADLGDFVQVTGAPAWVSPNAVKQVALGQQEQLGTRILKIAWNAVPESPYETAIADDAVLGHADTDGSLLLAGWGQVTASGGAASGGVLAGPYWAVAQAVSALMTAGDTLRVSAGTNAGAALYTITAIEAPFAGFQNVHMSPATPHTPDSTDVLVQLGVSPSATSLAVSPAAAGIAPWTTAGADFPFDVNIGGERVTVTGIGPLASGSVSSPGTSANIVFVTVAPGLYLVAWQVTVSGTLSGTDVNNFAFYNGTTFLTSSVNPAVAGTYPQAPLVFTVAAAAPDIKILANNAGSAGSAYSAALSVPQLFTVARSVNGVAKVQAPGADVRLWTPAIMSIL